MVRFLVTLLEPQLPPAWTHCQINSQINMAKISYSQCSTKVIYLCWTKLREMVVVGSSVWRSGSIILEQQEEWLEIIRSHYGDFALRIGFSEDLRETGHCSDIPFEFPGKKTRLILLNIVHFLLLGGASEEIFRAYLYRPAIMTPDPH